MSIWHNKDISIANFNRRGQGCGVAHLGIEFVEVGEDYLVAQMPVDERTKQPYGLLHGGCSAALAETVGSAAANACIDGTRWHAVGIEINANHLRSVRSGVVTATGRPLHMGRTQQVWDIRIEDERARLVCVSRLTVAVVPRRD